jgi:hypothetical protein
MEQIGINGQGPKDSMNLGPDVCDKNIKGFVSVIRDTGHCPPDAFVCMEKNMEPKSAMGKKMKCGTQIGNGKK